MRSHHDSREGGRGDIFGFRVTERSIPSGTFVRETDPAMWTQAGNAGGGARHRSRSARLQ